MEVLKKIIYKETRLDGSEYYQAKVFFKTERWFFGLFRGKKEMWLRNVDFTQNYYLSDFNDCR